MEKKDQTQKLFSQYLEDPFGVRSVTLGGDTPSLQSEVDIINRRNNNGGAACQQGNTDEDHGDET